MSILAIDTATQVSSVAVASAEKLAAELTMQARLTHSETLMPHIAQVLQMASVKKEELTGIAVSIGPGSFTGLRIGLAAAKAMAYALQKPLVGVSTLAALAGHFPVPGVRIVTLLDAQKGNAYYEHFSWEQGQLVSKQAAAVGKVTELVTACGDLAMPVILTGDIVAKKVRDKMTLPTNVQVAPAQQLMPRAANVAQLGLQRLARGEADNVMDLEPRYIRRSEAEVLWEQRHPEAKACNN